MEEKQNSPEQDKLNATGISPEETGVALKKDVNTIDETNPIILKDLLENRDGVQDPANVADKQVGDDFKELRRQRDENAVPSVGISSSLDDTKAMSGVLQGQNKEEQAAELAPKAHNSKLPDLTLRVMQPAMENVGGKNQDVLDDPKAKQASGSPKGERGAAVNINLVDEDQVPVWESGLTVPQWASEAMQRMNVDPFNLESMPRFVVVKKRKGGIKRDEIKENKQDRGIREEWPSQDKEKEGVEVPGQANTERPNVNSELPPVADFNPVPDVRRQDEREDNPVIIPNVEPEGENELFQSNEQKKTELNNVYKDSKEAEQLDGNIGQAQGRLTNLQKDGERDQDIPKVPEEQEKDTQSVEGGFVAVEALSRRASQNVDVRRKSIKQKAAGVMRLGPDSEVTPGHFPIDPDKIFMSSEADLKKSGKLEEYGIVKGKGIAPYRSETGFTKTISAIITFIGVSSLVLSCLPEILLSLIVYGKAALFNEDPPAWVKKPFEKIKARIDEMKSSDDPDGHFKAYEEDLRKYQEALKKHEEELEKYGKKSNKPRALNEILVKDRVGLSESRRKLDDELNQDNLTGDVGVDRSGFLNKTFSWFKRIFTRNGDDEKEMKNPEKERRDVFLRLLFSEQKEDTGEKELESSVRWAKHERIKDRAESLRVLESAEGPDPKSEEGLERVKEKAKATQLSRVLVESKQRKGSFEIEDLSLYQDQDESTRDSVYHSLRSSMNESGYYTPRSSRSVSKSDSLDESKSGNSFSK